MGERRSPGWVNYKELKYTVKLVKKQTMKSATSVDINLLSLHFPPNLARGINIDM